LFLGTKTKRKSIEIPFDVTYYIVNLLDSVRSPHSYQVDVTTLKRLCLVSRSFNAAATRVLYSSIILFETTALALATTARTNPSLLHHCNSLCFQPSATLLGTVAQIVSYCPNLRRFVWLGSCMSTKICILTSHLSRMTDLVFTTDSLFSLGIDSVHQFPMLERLVIADIDFGDDNNIDILSGMSCLTDIVTHLPGRYLMDDEVDSYAQNIVAVVTHTPLRRIIWAYLAHDADDDSPGGGLEEYLPICLRVHSILHAANAACGRELEITFEFVPGSRLMIRSRVLDGTIWELGEVGRQRVTSEEPLGSWNLGTEDE
jgi:hypothetical protein